MRKTVTSLLVICLVVGAVPTAAVAGGLDGTATVEQGSDDRAAIDRASADPAGERAGERADRPLAATDAQSTNDTTAQSANDSTAQSANNTTAQSANNTTAQSADNNTTQAANGTTVTILSYNDIQTAAAEDRNVSRLATLVNRRRAAHENPTVLVGAGDEVGPHALSPISQWRAPIEVLNHLDPAAEVVGNHEFDYGLDEVDNFTAASEFPWLATNLVNASTGEAFDGTESYEIVERNGTRIGVIGLLDRGATYGKTNINFSARGLELRNFTEVGAQTATMLKQEENVDVVVALAHTGVPQAKQLANASDAVDVIAVGDDEIRYPPRETSGTIITESVARAQYLSEINLTVSDGEVVGWNGRLLEVTDAIPKNETVSGIVTDYRAEAKLDTVVARSEVPLNATFAANYHRETNYGNFVTDAMRNATGATVAITNAGGIRSDSVYGPGNITGGDVYNTLPFSNTVVSVNLTGRELRETLASQVVTLESEAGQQYGAEISQQVSGVRFEWVAHNDTRTIRDVYVNEAGPDEPANWTQLDPSETYEVAVNSFMKGGGDGYPLADAPVVQETDRLLAEVVIEYMESKGTIAPTVEGRMQRVDVSVGHTQPIALDGAGNVSVSVSVPEGYDGFVPGTFQMSAPGTQPVAAESVEYENDTGTLEIRFDDAELAALAGDRSSVALDLYGGYNSTVYDRAFFDYSRLNADVYATVVENGTATTTGAETTGTAATTEAETATETETATTTGAETTAAATTNSASTATTNSTETANSSSLAGPQTPALTDDTASRAVVGA